MTQPLLSACGVGKGCRTVFDCTAGLLGDAILLAGRGMSVTACERNAEMIALQREILAGAASTLGSGGITLMEGDSREALRAIVERAAGDPGGARPDVVYIDPMHPPRRKGSLAKKAMREVREVVGDDEDAGELLALGLLAAGRRVVVKWPRTGPGLETRLPGWWFARAEGRAPVKPSGSVLGRATRWDVFTPRHPTGDRQDV